MHSWGWKIVVMSMLCSVLCIFFHTACSSAHEQECDSCCRISMVGVLLAKSSYEQDVFSSVSVLCLLLSVQGFCCWADVMVWWVKCWHAGLLCVCGMLLVYESKDEVLTLVIDSQDLAIMQIDEIEEGMAKIKKKLNTCRSMKLRNAWQRWKRSVYQKSCRSGNSPSAFEDKKQQELSKDWSNFAQQIVACTRSE